MLQIKNEPDIPNNITSGEQSDIISDDVQDDVIIAIPSDFTSESHEYLDYGDAPSDIPSELQSELPSNVPYDILNPASIPPLDVEASHEDYFCL